MSQLLNDPLTRLGRPFPSVVSEYPIQSIQPDDHDCGWEQRADKSRLFPTETIQGFFEDIGDKQLKQCPDSHRSDRAGIPKSMSPGEVK